MGPQGPKESDMTGLWRVRSDSKKIQESRAAGKASLTAAVPFSC